MTEGGRDRPLGTWTGRRVLFLTYHFPLEGEPGAFRPLTEARLMARAGLDVVVVTSGVQYMTGDDLRASGGWLDQDECEGIRILRTWAPGNHRRSLITRVVNYLAYSALAAVAAVVRVGEVDRVFVGSDPVFLLPFAFLVSKIKRAGMTLDERDLYPETALALGILRPGPVATLWFKFAQFFRRHAVGVLAATPGLQRQLVSYGFSDRPVRMMPNADPFLELPPPSQAVRDPEHRPILVGYAGGLGQANDVGTILRAAEQLRDHDDLTFLILGSGEKRASYEEFVRKRGLTNVNFRDALPRTEARAVVSTFDIAVQPLHADPHFRHTLTSKTFDYMALGRPIVFSGEGDTRELLEKSGAGIATPPRDASALAEALRRLAADAGERVAMGARGRTWYERNITPDIIGAELLAALCLQEDTPCSETTPRRSR